MTPRTELAILDVGASSCVHHWLLSDPVNGAIQGRCKRCGGVREFPAQPDGTDHLRDVRELAAALRVTLSRQTA